MEGMNKYHPPTSATPLENLINRLENPPQRPNYANLDPKYLPSRPPLALNLSKKTSKDISCEQVHTPKTARTAYNKLRTTFTSFNRTLNVTPDDNKINKYRSCLTPSKIKPTQYCENLTIDLKDSKVDYCPPRTNRTNKVMKTRCITTGGVSAAQEANKTFLRQTISNANSWQLRNANNAIPSLSPIKPIEGLRDKNKSSYDNLSFRKKLETQYTPYQQTHFPITVDYKKDLKSKISSTRHSRQNSGVQDEPSTPTTLKNSPSLLSNSASLNNTPTLTIPSTFTSLTSNPSQLETLNFKSKTTLNTGTVQRNSQDKLPTSTSTTLRKNTTMNQTDPSGSFYNLTLSRKTSKNLSMKLNQTQTPSNEIKIEDFQIGSTKGQGRFGKVFPARHKKGGFLVAIKQIKKEDVRLMLDQFVMELKINFFANHPNIVKMYGFFHDKLHFYIIMEYMQEGSLYKQIKIHKKFKEDQASARLFELCQAVEYLHSQDILHRDIKPQNIVLSNGVSKLCDFGWAIYSKERRNTYCGTLDYVCPQILEGESYDNFVDIWAIGVLAYQMLTGKAPFYHISRKQTMKSIMNCDFSFPSDMSFACKMFIKKALQKNPDQRFTIDSLLSDRFISKHKQTF